MEEEMPLTEVGIKSLCFGDESGIIRKVVVLSEYKEKTGKSGRFYSPIPGFLSPDLEIKVLQGPVPLCDKEFVVYIDFMDFSPEERILKIHLCDNEESKEIKEILNTKFGRISISSWLGCKKFEGHVAIKEKIEGGILLVYIFDVLSTNYDFDVTFYSEELVTIHFEGVR